MTDYSQPARDDFDDWRVSVEREWERWDSLRALDERAAKDEPVEEDE